MKLMINMKKIYLLCFLIFVCLGSAVADSLKGGYPGCISKELYTQSIRALIDENRQEWDYLSQNGCFLLPPGLSITVLEQSIFSQTVKIRVFVGKDTIVIWTHIKNVKKDDG